MSSLESAALRVGVDDAEVDSFFEGCASSFAQQGLAWRDVITEIDRDEPMFLGCRRDGKLVGVLPGYRFEGPLGAILTSVPQAGPLGGVACSAPDLDPAPIYASLLQAYTKLAEQTGCALASVITNPFWPDRDFYQSFGADYVLENSCLALDLERDVAEDGFPNASKQLHRQLRRADRAGFAIDEQQSEAKVLEWYDLHAARHAEIGATPLPRQMFEAALARAVPRGKARFFFVRDANGEMLGGGFYVMHSRVVDALMPAVLGEQARRGANYFLARHSIRWAREKGFRFYNWQASPPGGGVYDFKKQWGSRDHGYAYLTKRTGDASAFLNSTPEAVRASYPWHYVLPFDRIGSGELRGASSRKGAWESLERPR